MRTAWVAAGLSMIFRAARRGGLVALVSLTMALAACSSPAPGTHSSLPPNNLPSAAGTVQALVTALQSGKLDQVPFSTPETAAQADLDTIMAGMDGLRPSVTPASVTYDGINNTATVVLNQSYPLGSKTFDFQSTASLLHAASGWQVVWAPTIVHPQLSEQTRLRHTRDLPKRAPIIGHDNVTLVQQGLVFDLGIDKHIVKPAEALTSASALAKLMKVDATQFVKQVKAAGTDAFVIAITVRPADVPSAIEKIPGARALPNQAMLGPSSTFAQAILGVMGSPTAAQVAASRGDIQATDSVGISGLEMRDDAQLRGTPGHTIAIVPRTGPSASASPSAAASASSTAGSASGAASIAPTPVLYSSSAVPGTALRITLDLGLQTKAEKVLGAAHGIASMVVLDRSSGAILAATNSSAAGGNPDATFGRYAPGSTFKIATSLAVLRHGLSPSSLVDCPHQITVNGKVFKNYSDYPANGYGRIPLSEAVANSCNTAFIKLSTTISSADLAEAAGSLGVGIDYNAGFPSFFGSVPTTSDPVVQAADAIGQGDVLASPMAMAGLSASVASAHTIIPHLVVGTTPTPTGAPLTSAEGAQLQTLMKAVVTSGTGQTLAGLVTGAKTGTAEYDAGKTIKTHAWMIAWNARYAIAVMVYDGQTGSGTAGPLIRQFLS